MFLEARNLAEATAAATEQRHPALLLRDWMQGQVSASGGLLGFGHQGRTLARRWVFTPLLCFFPGPRHLQSRQSVPGTHDQHPVGADAHQSVHALGH